MQKKHCKSVILILILGVMLRLTLFYVSPPNNSFDDHLEVINIYANTCKQPYPSECWECYQPPIYYIISAVTFKAVTALNFNDILGWKAVQFINPFLSILVLIIFYKLLRRTEIPESKMLLYMSFIAVLPVDLFTASMVGNDYLLVFSAVASLFYFLKNVDDINKKKSISFFNFSCLASFVIIGALSKQQGLILLTFPTTIVLFLIAYRVKFPRVKILIIYIFLILLSFTNEIHKYTQTSIFLVSNQDFYNYADGQFPGSLDKVEFTTFRLHSLFQNPFLSNQTSASLPTEIFARTFFDYEWRFLNPKIPAAKVVGYIAYILGIFWVLYFTGAFISALRRRNKRKFLLTKHKLLLYTPIIVAILFFAVPVLQTIRYPYFSSMKATFALSGIIIILIVHAMFTRQITISRPIVISLTVLNISFGILLVYTITSFLPITINHLSGPLWPIP